MRISPPSPRAWSASLSAATLWMVIAVVLGGALGTFFMAFHSTQGPQLGLPQMIQSRPQFGYVGALLVWGVALIAYIGFNAFNQILAAQTLHSLYRLRIDHHARVHAALGGARGDRLRPHPPGAALDRHTLIVALLVFTVAALVEDAARRRPCGERISGGSRFWRSSSPRPPTKYHGRFMSRIIRATCRATSASAPRSGGPISGPSSAVRGPCW